MFEIGNMVRVIGEEGIKKVTSVNTEQHYEVVYYQLDNSPNMYFDDELELIY